MQMNRACMNAQLSSSPPDRIQGEKKNENRLEAVCLYKNFISVLKNSSLPTDYTQTFP